MAHTHTLVFSFSSGVESLASFCLLAGFALQDDVLLPFAFTYLLVGADLDVRTDLGDDPDSPRR